MHYNDREPFPHLVVLFILQERHVGLNIKTSLMVCMLEEKSGWIWIKWWVLSDGWQLADSKWWVEECGNFIGGKDAQARNNNLTDQGYCWGIEAVQ